MRWLFNLGSVRGKPPSKNSLTEEREIVKRTHQQALHRGAGYPGLPETRPTVSCWLHIANSLSKKRGLLKLLLLSSVIVLSSCSGSGSDSDPLNEAVTTLNTAESSDPLPVTIDTDIPVTLDAGDMLDRSDFEPPGDPGESPLAEDLGDLLPAVFPTQTTIDLAYAQAGADLITRLNESLALPADIDVNFADCGTANAFFAPADANPDATFLSEGGAIFMCHELTELFAAFFTDADQTFAANTFVLMHELGHSLVDQLDLPVLGIEESYVDGVAAVLLGESGLADGLVLAGWFFAAQMPAPFFDSHRAGPQRFGDLACWGVGAEPALLDDPFISGIAQQLFEGGRDCVSEYQQQVRSLQIVLGPNIRGGLQNLLSLDP